MRYLPILLLALAPSAMANVKLMVFDCGSIEFDDVSAFSLSNDETPVRSLFVPCYLIEHPNGRLFWDAGLPLAMAGKGTIDNDGVRMRYDVSIEHQLADIGITPADIELVAFSHMHYDHVGAANLFGASTLLIQDTEFDAAFTGEDTIEFFQPALYAGLKDSKRQILDGDHDVFGDGSVVIVDAPGHTPGHQVLLLRLTNFGPLLLSGDLYHFRKSRELRRAPQFNTNAEQTFESMDKVEALVAAEGATFWIEHDQALARTLRMAPAYYD